MENPDTLILNLTFLGTMGVAFLMFIVLFLLGVTTLVLAGLGRLVALMLMLLFGRLRRVESIRFGPAAQQEAAGAPQAKAPGKPAPGTPGPTPAGLLRGGRMTALRTAVVRHPLLTAAKTAAKAAAKREPAVLSEGWAAAVSQADARAMAKARAAAPEIKVSVRDLPDRDLPAGKVAEVAPLVESALAGKNPAGNEPRSFRKPAAAPLSPLDTGSLMSLAGPPQGAKRKPAMPKPAAAPGTQAKDRQHLP